MGLVEALIVRTVHFRIDLSYDGPVRLISQQDGQVVVHSGEDHGLSEAYL